MGRYKTKLDAIREANKRILGEQNEKLSDDYVQDLVTNVQGLVPYVVQQGDNISDIVRNSRAKGGLYYRDFDVEMNNHIKDPNNIYPGDVLLFMSAPWEFEESEGDEIEDYFGI